MEILTLSPSAYILRKQWECEDKKLFIEFHKDMRKIQIINALAEMLAKLERGKSDKVVFHC